MITPTDLIEYIVWYAARQSISLSTNRLVKFLYLADLYHAKVFKGQTLTKFPWAFVYYGPYCSEAMSAIDQATIDGVICKETYESKYGGKDYHLFKPGCDASDIEHELHIVHLSMLQSAIKKFGQDTPQLLDYVYFETEPMRGVKKGDKLDFTKVAREQAHPLKIKINKIPSYKIDIARQKAEELGKKLQAHREYLSKEDQEISRYKGKAYVEFCDFLEGQELEIGLNGVAKIEVDD